MRCISTHHTCKRHILATASIALVGLLQGATASATDVLLRTTAGDIVVRLNEDRAPNTARNFLRYVDRGEYNGGTFYRTVTARNQQKDNYKIEVIQGGRRTNSAPGEPIRLETTSDTGLRHLAGTLSMARDGPATANSEFFICLSASPELDFGGRRNSDRLGFAAFGQVIKGMNTIRKIHEAKADGQSLTPPIRILSARRVKQ